MGTFRGIFFWVTGKRREIPSKVPREIRRNRQIKGDFAGQRIAEGTERVREERLLRTGLEKNLVGARGFEPPTPTTPLWCATRLRYAPTAALCGEVYITFLQGICKPWSDFLLWRLFFVTTRHEPTDNSKVCIFSTCRTIGLTMNPVG